MSPNGRLRKHVAAHLDSFTDEGLETLSVGSSFQRVSDDEEAAFASEQDDETEAGPTEASEKKKRSTSQACRGEGVEEESPNRKKFSRARSRTEDGAADSEADDAIPTESR